VRASRKGWLLSGLKESGDRRGASVIYCHSPKGESKAKRQDWHTDLDGRKCPGHKHVSMIAALDDDGVSLPSRGARDVSKPIPAGRDQGDGLRARAEGRRGVFPRRSRARGHVRHGVRAVSNTRILRGRRVQEGRRPGRGPGVLYDKRIAS
jgi:hypothetical protein